MLPGASGLRWIPRKMAGIAMMTIAPSMLAIVMLSVVLDRAIHLYFSPCSPAASSCGSRRDITPTLNQPTAKRLLAGNYLLAAPWAERRFLADSGSDLLVRSVINAVTRAMVTTAPMPPARPRDP